MNDVPYSSLLDRPVPFPGRQSLPETSGVYAWWVLKEIRTDAGPDGAGVRPLYLGAAKNIAASVASDAEGIRDTALRMGLATIWGEQIGLRPRTGVARRPLTISERQRMDHWISANLLVSWSELPQPATYLAALARALDPQLKP